MDFQMITVLFLALYVSSSVLAQKPLFTKTPAPVSSSSSATFEFSVDNPCTSCRVQCKIDESPVHDCSRGVDSYGNLANGKHTFEVSVKSPNSSIFSTSFNWTVDTIPPTGSITVKREFTNALNATLHVRLSEACPGNGGFKCFNVSDCDVAVHGSGSIIASSLQVVEQNLAYTLLVRLSEETQVGRVIVALAKDFCTDSAGNKFVRSENSSVIVRFDRTPVDVNLWTGITEVQVVVNKQHRTLQATNKSDDLGIFLDFSRPIINTTEEILESLTVNDGVLLPIQRKSHGKRRYGFLLTNTSNYSVVTVKLEEGLQSRDGTVVASSGPIIFLYDSVRPKVTLVARPSKTRKRIVDISVHFSEPVFLFDSSDITTTGNITRFSEVSKSKYYVELLVPGDEMVSVFVSENKTTDIAGNPNLASNHLQVRHYSTPTIAVASSSFVTAGVLCTFFASGLLTISSTSLGAAGAISSRALSSIVSNPSGNLLGMAGHLQVFALSYYASNDFPVSYSETVRNIQWIIPHANIPWEKHRNSLDHKLHLQTTGPYSLNEQIRRKLGSNMTLYGPTLTAKEYQDFFQNGQVSGPVQKYTGWHDFGTNMFWLGVVGGVLVLCHILLVYTLRWRTESTLRGGLCFPRFEFFLLISSLPCICQASFFIIRGGTTGGLILGVLLLAVPVGFFLSVLMFLLVAVIWGALVQYKEYVKRPTKCEKNICRIFISTLFGTTDIGKWIRKEGLSSTFLPKYGLLFESRKGIPRIVYVDEDYASKWIDSEGKGIGRMKPANSDEESLDMSVSGSQKLLGAARAFYILIDIARKITLGIILSSHDVSCEKLSVILSVTLLQLIYLVFVKPYIRRGVQIVESFSLLSELAVFVIGLRIERSSSKAADRRSLGIVMVSILLWSFICQLINEWYALMEKLVKLSAWQEPSFKAGIKMLIKGLVFPFIPQRKWPKFITPPQQPSIGLVPVVHLSPSPDFQPSRVLPTGSPSSFTETGGPVYDPGSPSLVDPRSLQHSRSPSYRKQGSFQRSDGRKTRSFPRSDGNSSELRTLRELAKASFPGSKRDDDGLQMNIMRMEAAQTQLSEERIFFEDPVQNVEVLGDDGFDEVFS